MRKIIPFAIGFLVATVLVTITPASGGDAIALISSLGGKVEVQRANQKELRAARLGEHLFENDVLFTYDNSRASLLFSSGSIITVYPKSRVALSRREPEQKQGKPLAVVLIFEFIRRDRVDQGFGRHRRFYGVQVGRPRVMLHLVLFDGHQQSRTSP